MNLSLRRFAAGLALGLVGCGGAASAQWDAQSSAALRAQPEALLHHLDAGNFDALIANLDDDSLVLDLDENNHPVRYQGREEVTRYFRGLEQGAKAQGLKFKSTIVRNDCSATPVVGYCVVEFDQTITAGGSTMGPFKFRGTVVARKVGETWRWSHWHGSFREVPAAAPAPAPAAEAAKGSAGTTTAAR
jgi:ketosteroid isomerase-like protein